MNKENVKKWVDALRSGEYKQARGIMFDGEGYCCLGVACAVAGLTPIKVSGSYRFGRERTGEVLPEEAQDWLGISKNYCFSLPTHEDSSALYLNDGKKYSFSQIADVIEAEFLKEENAPA